MRPKPRIITGGKVVNNNELVIREAKKVEVDDRPSQNVQLDLKVAEREHRDEIEEAAEPELELEVKGRTCPANEPTLTGPTELKLGPVKKKVEADDEAIVVIDERHSKAKKRTFVDPDRKKRLAEIMNDDCNKRTFSTLADVYEASFDPRNDPKKGWYARTVVSKGSIDAMNPRLDEALDIMLEDLEQRVASGKLYNGAVFLHFEYPVRRGSSGNPNIVIDHSAEKQELNPLWEYQGDDYIVLEMWLPYGKHFSTENIYKVEILRTKTREEAIRAFMNQRQTTINKYESGEYELGELSITVPHLNELPPLDHDGADVAKKPHKCRVKGCQCDAKPGRAWCEFHIEMKENEKAKRPRRAKTSEDQGS